MPSLVRTKKNSPARTVAKAMKAQRVPKALDGIYNEFLTRKEPFDVREELAYFRALQIEQREIIEQKRIERIDAAASEVRRRVDGIIERGDGMESTVQSFLDAAEDAVKSTMSSFFHFAFRSLDDVRAVSDLLDKTVKAAEKMKRIQEGVKLVVEIDTNVILTLLNKCIFPVVRSPEMRSAIVQNLSAIGVSQMPGMQVPGHVVGDVSDAGLVENTEAGDRQEESVARSVAGLLADVSVSSGVTGDIQPIAFQSWD